ncbi:MAG: glycoside hydrolase family 15 protein [Chloroflexota bacterium]
MPDDSYPPIGDYGYIADCHSCALVSRSGSIDWACMPRFDSGSCFARILDWHNGGFCQISPIGSYRSSRRYIDNTLVLETIFENDEGKVRLIDCFTMKKGGKHDPHQQILRVVEGLEGTMKLKFDCAPRFEYGAVKPWIREYREAQYIALGGSDGLLISGDFCLGMKHRHDLDGTCSVGKGERAYLSLSYRRPEILDEGGAEIPSISELSRRLEETIDWWRSWVSQISFSGPHATLATRSAIVLKGLSNAPTGAIAAAATTSLPETPAGSRNWDYRFTWIRDSCFAVRSLAAIGLAKEADGFRRFVERSAAGSAEELQILFGMGGERRLKEQELTALEGYRGARPVRIGNAAEKQTQLDVYGELLDLSWLWYSRGHSPDQDYWEFLTGMVETAAADWNKPDRGIWEMRGEPRHFVHSKVMCWAALNYGILLAQELERAAPIERWKKVREDVRGRIERDGYDKDRGIFVQAFDSHTLDAALLLIPTVGFIDYADERMIRTTDVIRQQLAIDGLLRRYPEGSDGMPGSEGVFLACSFWLVNCLARQGRLDEAQEVFDRALSTGNDLGLFSEEYDVERREMLGNYPQALTHLSLITALVALCEMSSTRSRLPSAGICGA